MNGKCVTCDFFNLLAGALVTVKNGWLWASRLTNQWLWRPVAAAVHCHSDACWLLTCSVRNAGNVPHAKLVICGCMYMAFVWRDFRVDLDFTFKGMKLLHLCKPFVEQQDAYMFAGVHCTCV